MENPGELSHRESVIGREVAHVLAVVNYGKSAGFVPYLPGEQEDTCDVSLSESQACTS